MHRRMVSRNLVLGILFFTSLLNIAELQEDKKTEVDPRGYITYCPCVGECISCTGVFEASRNIWGDSILIIEIYEV